MATVLLYGETSSGVGGDVMSATTQAAFMVGASAMGPEPVAVVPLDDENEDEARERVMKRFEKIGVQIMNRTGSGGGPFDQNPIGGVLSDPSKKAMAAQILGQAYVQAYNLVRENREAVRAVADELIERKEIFGDDLVALLDRQDVKKPDIDFANEESWPKV